MTNFFKWFVAGGQVSIFVAKNCTNVSKVQNFINSPPKDAPKWRNA